MVIAFAIAAIGCGTSEHAAEPEPLTAEEPAPVEPPHNEPSDPCDLTGPWTSVLYQLPGEPPTIDQLTFVSEGGDQYTLNSSWGDASDASTRNDCTYTTNDGEYRYEIAPDGSVSLFDVDGLIRVYARE